MQHLESFSSFKQQETPFTRPEITYNERLKCIKIGDHYLFPEDNKVLHQSDEAVNEFLGVDLSDFMPSSPSEWVHLGVDGAAAILGAVPTPMTVGIAKAIDIIHAFSYFIEAKYKPAEATSLYISGGITAMFAAFPGIGESLVLGIKRLLKASFKVAGKFFGLFFRIPYIGKASGFIIDKILRFPQLKAIIGKLAQKLTEGKMGSLLAKLPIVKQIIAFAKNGLDLALEKAGTHLTRDLFAYAKSIAHAMQPEIKVMYKTLDKSVQKSIDEKSFIAINEAMLHKKMTGVGSIVDAQKLTGTPLLNAKDALRNFFGGGGTGREAAKKYLTTNTAAINGSLERIAVLNEEFVAKALPGTGLKHQVLASEFNRLVSASVISQLKKGVPLAALKIERAEIMRLAIKSAGGTLAKNVGKAVAKRSVQVGVKNALDSGMSVENPLSGVESPFDGGSNTSGATETDSSIRTIPAPDGAASTTDTPPATGDTTSGEPVKTDSGTDAPAAPAGVDKERYFLKVSEVKSLTDLGTSELAFRTYKKDDTEGKLVLSGGIYDNVDMSDKVNSYSNSDDLLNDIKLVKGKEGKDRVRDGELKKWERSVELSTPKITDLDANYLFYFMVRDRSAISFAKKTLDEKIQWDAIFSAANIEKGFTKLGQSLYVIIKKKAK